MDKPFAEMIGGNNIARMESCVLSPPLQTYTYVTLLYEYYLDIFRDNDFYWEIHLQEENDFNWWYVINCSAYII